MSERTGGRLSRRAVITAAAATAGVAATGGALAATQRDGAPPRPSGTVPFHGAHQAGIATPQQQYAFFAAFDLESTDPVKGERLTPAQAAANFQRLMGWWTIAAERITQGHAPGPRPGGRPDVPPDSGIADGLEPSRLTITFGLGPGLFARIGQERQRPRRLEPLPAFRTDRLEAAWSGGELLVQICGDDLQTISRAFRTLRSRAPGVARLRWTQQGFLGRFGDATPRNLFGHKDGTANPRPGDAKFDRAVWSDGADEPAWFSGGTYLVFRKIRMDLPKWDTSSTRTQDETIGRRRDNGAPLSGGHEFSAPDLGKAAPHGGLLVPADSHLALVRNVPMLRRSYNYDYGFQANSQPVADHHDTPGEDHDHGQDMPKHSGGGHAAYDAGTLFCAYLRDPAEFVRVQHKLAESDRLNAFIRHTGSAVFAMPPGARPGKHVAAGLLPS
ncbi:Dyp-type peroxidase [Actinomadura spongiicola]|uniref:Dyp-type peroxidase n=1 Tax=Actinomadura spongiicola TaxID=2303421 RepID=A0A372G9M9_9ACTN|nr:Dyp-type peroxidase [Actinomadura spongiicola]RFS82094.1 Dyp-type peroxidase [Actinomadura spongiicola]